MTAINITFARNKKTKNFILNLFDKITNSENLIVEKKTGQPVLDMNGQEISSDRLGFISNGSEIYVKDDIISIVDFYKNKKRR